MMTYFFDSRKTWSSITKIMFQMAAGLQNNICDLYVTNKQWLGITKHMNKHRVSNYCVF